jgi:probable rRNA maturation factor
MQDKAADKASRSGPAIAVHNRQRAIRIDSLELQVFAELVLQACLLLPRKNRNQLANLDELDVILVSDRRIAELHRRFLNIRGPTDVITFRHGEIFVSVETARRHARHFGTSIVHELRLYIAHGLLHLHGFDDKNTAGAAEMMRIQERLVATATKLVSARRGSKKGSPGKARPSTG